MYYIINVYNIYHYYHMIYVSFYLISDLLVNWKYLVALKERENS